MSRIRNISPEFFKDDELASLGPYHMILFAGLWTIADKRGRLKDRPQSIKSEVMPHFHHRHANVNRLLSELASDTNCKTGEAQKPYIIRYEIDGQKYIQIRNFERYQCTSGSERDSKIPEPLKEPEIVPEVVPVQASENPQAELYSCLTCVLHGAYPRTQPVLHESYIGSTCVLPEDKTAGQRLATTEQEPLLSSFDSVGVPLDIGHRTYDTSNNSNTDSLGTFSDLTDLIVNAMSNGLIQEPVENFSRQGQSQNIYQSKTKKVPDSVIGYWSDKARRDPTQAELNSLRSLCKHFPTETVNLAIGDAVVCGYLPTDFGVITLKARDEMRPVGH